MSGEWKPGDVALVSGMRAMYGSQRNAIPCWQFADGSRCSADALAVPLDRRLVVIDPEDAEQVERLLGLIHDTDHGLTCGSGTCNVDTLVSVLRGFAAPPPQIEEPQGLGAVVESDNGRRYVRQHDGWWRGPDPCTLNWTAVKAVRKLSDGVTP